MGYVPDSSAQGLRTKTTKLLRPRHPGHDQSRFTRASFSPLRNAPTNLATTCSSRTRYNQPEREDACLRRLLSRRVDGLFITPVYRFEAEARIYQEIVARNIPTVLLGSPAPFCKNFPGIEIEELVASYNVTKHLLGLGHKKIAYLTGPPAAPWAHERFEGYRRALREAGLEVDDKLVFQPAAPWKTAPRPRCRCSMKAVHPTAIQAVSDLVAIGCAETLLQQGIKIPDDISLAGFGNILAAEFYRVPLTTVSQPKYRLGIAAVETMMNLIRGEPVPTQAPRRRTCGTQKHRAAEKVIQKTNHFLFASPNNSRKLFITTTTVLPSWPTTPMVSGIFPSIANVTSTTTVPSEMKRFCRMMRRARWLKRKAARKFSSRSCISTTSACSSAASAPRAPIATPMCAAARLGASFTPSPTIATFLPWRAQFPDGGDLLFRLQFGAHVVQIQFRRADVRRRPCGRRSARRMQALRRASSPMTEADCGRMSSRKMTRPSKSPPATQTSEKPASGWRRHPASRISGPLAGRLRQPTRARRADIPLPLRAGLQALAGDGFKMRKLQRHQALLLAVARDGAGERMRGQFFQRIGQLRDFVFAAGRKTFDFFHAQFAGGERAGLVESRRR